MKVMWKKENFPFFNHDLTEFYTFSMIEAARAVSIPASSQGKQWAEALVHR